MRRAQWLPVVAAIGVSLVSLAHGQEPAPQQPSSQQPTFRAGVKLVRVDVSVTDRDDAAIADLQPGDFEIEEDGVRQTAETVQFIRLDGQPEPGSTESLPIRSLDHARLEAARDDVRIFAIFFDDYHVDRQPSITLPMRAALARFVDELGPTDLVAIMDPLTPLSALTFTRDRNALLEKVHAFEGRRGQLVPVRSPIEEAQISSRNVGEIRAGVTLSALNALVTFLGGLREGRKSVLFVSQGPPLMLALGSDLVHRLDEVLQSANRANVTVNVFDPRPLGGGARIGGSESLSALASETGGRRIVNLNRPDRDLERIIEDASAYYLVGYTPARDFADGKFHRIQVRVDRKGARVSARRGYWAPTAVELAPPAAPEARMPAGQRDALAALAATAGGRAVTLWVGVTRGEAGRARVAVSWDPAARPPASDDSTNPAERPVSLTVEPQTTAGVSLGEPLTIGTGQLPADEATLAAFDLAPGAVVLHLEAHGASGETVDRWTTTVRVPDLSGVPLVLSTPRVQRARSPFELRALQAAAAPTPVAARDFQRSDRVFVDVDCDPAAPTPAMAAALLTSAGAVLATLPVPPPANGTTRIELPVGSLAIGSYVLRITARNGAGQAQQLLAFRIAP